MDDLLYLDTARVGRMSAGASDTFADYLALARHEGGSAYFDRFLRAGLDACPTWVRDRHPNLSCWTGISSLQHALRRAAGSRPDLPVILALRSTQLMKFAARLLFRPCRCVLTTDLGWPGYEAILAAECQRSNGRIATVPLRDRVLQERMTEDDVVETVARAFIDNRCEGLFLPAVSNLGVRLPVARIVRHLERAREVRFVVVDGAQDFCHMSPDLRDEYCDLYLAGCHKWLRAYHPLALAFYGHRRSCAVIESLLARLVAALEIDDPLVRYAAHFGAERVDRFAETVNLGPLFSCQGAIGDGCAVSETASQLGTRLQCLDRIATLATDSGWRPLLPDPALRSGILLAQAARERTRRADPEVVRLAFRDRGVGLTTYEGGIIRLSMPEVALAEQELLLLRTAFRGVA